MALRILIVEDDKHIRKILEQLLTKEASLAALKTEVVVASDGTEGLERLDKSSFDLVVSDLLMPRMDGFHFARELRKHKNGATVPLIVTSAIYKDQATINRLQQETGAHFYAKPFQVQEILGAVKKLLNLDKPAPAITVAASQPARKDPSLKLSAGHPTMGDLAQRPPPRMLLELWEQKVSGTLTLQRGKVKKQITLVHGTPVAMTSNLRTETLGNFLVARGVLDEERHRQALARAKDNLERIGQALVELGWLSDEELLKHLQAQMRARIVSVLRWKDGDWMFLPGLEAAPSVQTPVETPRVIFAGLGKTAHVDDIAQELAPVRGRLALTARAERHRDAFMRVFGHKVLTALQRRPLIEELLVAEDPTPILVQLDALIACGMVEVETPLSAKKDAREETDPIALQRLPVQPSAESDATSPEHNLYDELFGDEPSVVRVTSEPEPEESPFDEDEVSGVVQVPRGLERRLQARPLTTEPVGNIFEEAHAAELRKEVLHEYLSMQGKDAYAVVGVSHEASELEIQNAYRQLMRRFDLGRFANVDLGPDYARLEEIHQMLKSAVEKLTNRESRSLYDRDLPITARVKVQAVEAELLAKKAQQKLDAGDAAGALALVESALQAAPGEADYHALAGWARFVADGGNAARAPRAWTHLSAAFEIDRDHVDAHEFAGRIAAASGDDERAIDHLQRVLDQDPTRAAALTAYESACARRGEWKRLERQYRKLIHRLGDHRDPERALQLWWRLAELYRHRLDDKQSAKVAYEIAAKLAPDDPRPREALAQLFGGDPGSWRDTARALRESWRLVPDDAALGRKLFDLHVDGGRWDAALCVAAAMELRGAGDDETNALLARLQPRFLPRALQPLDGKPLPQLIDEVRHPDDDRDLSALFARVFAVWQPPFNLQALGVTAEDAIDGAQLPAPFARVLGYVATQLGVKVPPVYRRGDFALDVHVGAARPPILLAGPQALALADMRALAFRLGRALTYLLPGRAVAGALPGRQLKTTLLAAMTLALPALRIDDPDGDVSRLRAQLAQASPMLARDVKPSCERLIKGPQAQLSLTRYVRGLLRTADRVGLLLCSALDVAVRIVMQNAAPGAENDLIDFALSDEYVAAREALGLSVMV